jgi:hypothetical protein
MNTVRRSAALGAISVVAVVVACPPADTPPPRDAQPRDPTPDDGGELSIPLPFEVERPIPLHDFTIIPPIRVDPDWSALLRNQQQAEPWVHVESIDVDGDGGGDFHIERRPGSGVLSTYWMEYRIVALGRNRILRGGGPHEEGAMIIAGDLLDSTSEAWLATVGGSLRLLEADASEFCGGPWWGVERRFLPVALVHSDRTGLAWIELSVSRQGAVAMHGVRLEWLEGIAARTSEPE